MIEGKGRDEECHAQPATMNYLKTSRQSWESALLQMGNGYRVYVPVKNESTLDYVLFGPEYLDQVILNEPKPATPLKVFFLPLRQNVSHESSIQVINIIIGVPSCDLAAIDLLDAMYLDETNPDPAYREKRERTIIMASDCHLAAEHCHCTAYSVNPYPERNCDVIINHQNGNIFIHSLTDKGEKIIHQLNAFCQFEVAGREEAEILKVRRLTARDELQGKTVNMPGTKDSSSRVLQAEHWLWKKHSEKCVSCGACAVICPTCTCFLLADRFEFEKVRITDSCQYPGFARVAAGEDSLKRLSLRFSNRYLCKYVWKPERFKVPACTGCGRCIDACIGRINKNEVIEQMAPHAI